MVGICIGIIFITAIIVLFRKKYKEIKEQSIIIDECTNSLSEALEGRYHVMEELINFSSGFLDDENRFVVKLVQAKLVPTNERQFVEKELVAELKRLLLMISENPELKQDKDYNTLRIDLAKAEKIIFEHKNDLSRLTKEYNSLIKSFPANIVALLGGFKAKKGFNTEFVTR